VAFDGQLLRLRLVDGRALAVPLERFPRLLHATPSERASWRLVGTGEGVHWPELDEDLGLDGLLGERPSAEGLPSLLRWLGERDAAHGRTS
jgi:hypothetical protein